jgi:hypothetical protein
LLPTFDSGEDASWLCGQVEVRGIDVCLGDEAVNGGLEIVDRSEHAALEEFGEEALDGIEAGRRGGGEVEGPAGMAGEPWAHLRMLSEINIAYYQELMQGIRHAIAQGNFASFRERTRASSARGDIAPR